MYGTDSSGLGASAFTVLAKRIASRPVPATPQSRTPLINMVRRVIAAAPKPALAVPAVNIVTAPTSAVAPSVLPQIDPAMSPPTRMIGWERQSDGSWFNTVTKQGTTPDGVEVNTLPTEEDATATPALAGFFAPTNPILLVIAVAAYFFLDGKKTKRRRRR